MAKIVETSDIHECANILNKVLDKHEEDREAYEYQLNLILNRSADIVVGQPLPTINFLHFQETVNDFITMFGDDLVDIFIATHYVADESNPVVIEFVKQKCYQLVCAIFALLGVDINLSSDFGYFMRKLLSDI